MLNRQFGRWTVIGLAAPKYSGRDAWDCLCLCGVKRTVDGKSLRRGLSNSCGCIAAERLRTLRTTHGETVNKGYTSEYSIWAAIKRRCFCPTDAAFGNYGARGITMCDQWRKSFSAFLCDVGRRPSLEYSIDRFPDNNGGYEPGNVRWATREEQANNVRTNRRLTMDGETLTVARWAERTGIGSATITRRIGRGWSTALALSTPIKTKYRHHKMGATGDAQ